MKPIFSTMLFLTILVNWTKCAVTTIAYSGGPGSTVTSSNSNQNTTLVTKDYSSLNFPVPEALWVWDGPGNNLNCNMHITIEHNITITCLSTMTIFAEADGNFTATFNGSN